MFVSRSGSTGIVSRRLNGGSRRGVSGRPTLPSEDRLIPSPIHRVLSTIRRHGVQHLLMGGQACILYGAAEFSRDADLAIVGDAQNLERLRQALLALEAVVTAVPPFDPQYLERGHAVHFRAEREDVRGLRIDVMTRMRGVDPFAALWERRTTLRLASPDDADPPLDAEIMSLPDLVAAKKTQRDKDWPMIRRLVEANYFAFRERASASDARVSFWLRELRTPELLAECSSVHAEAAAALAPTRAAVAAAIRRDTEAIERALAAEQLLERERDRVYWAPLRSELEQLRRLARGGEGR